MPAATELRPGSFGYKLREARRRAHMSQVDLATSANISQSTMSRLETGGEPGGAEIRRIAKALGLSPQTVWGWYNDDPEIQMRPYLVSAA